VIPEEKGENISLKTGRSIKESYHVIITRERRRTLHKRVGRLSREKTRGVRMVQSTWSSATFPDGAVTFSRPDEAEKNQ